MAADINVIDGKKIDEKELDEEILVVNGHEIAVNVNEPDDLRIAECLFNHDAL